MIPPIPKYSVPLPPHAGSFGAARKYDRHTGVDLYCDDGQNVSTIADGTVVGIGQFTGKAVNSEWWEDTWYVMIEHQNIVILYGELYKPILPHIRHGEKIRGNRGIGRVKRVLRKDKGLPMAMLHVEAYELGYRGEPCYWDLELPQPRYLIDPTIVLQELVEM